mgnify:CR=1 FL=1
MGLRREKNASAALRVSRLIRGEGLELNFDSLTDVITNLVGNAIKFTNEGYVKLEIRVQEDAKNRTRLEFRVSDTGIGIPKEMMANIFDFDKQKSTKGTAGEKGSGLGLALCHDIVKLNYGNIKIKSKEREGTVITAYIPMKPDREVAS